jgi:hypothetical protein
VLVRERKKKRQKFKADRPKEERHRRKRYKEGDIEQIGIETEITEKNRIKNKDRKRGNTGERKAEIENRYKEQWKVEK